MRNIYSIILEKHIGHSPLCLASIIETRGSAPQVLGASALFSTDQVLAGTLGGGILEASAQKKAGKVLSQGKPDTWSFDLAEDLSSAEGALCGGSVRVLLDPDPLKDFRLFQSITDSLDRGVPGVLATSWSGKDRLKRDWYEKGEAKDDMTGLTGQLRGSISMSLKENKCRLIIGEKGEWTFLEPVLPRPKLVIAGAGHIGKALSRMASLLDFEITLLDDRPEYANPENIPWADRITVKDIGKAMHEIPKTTDTYVVIVTRGHRDDAAALRQCIREDVAYIGMIGSRRKVRLMRQEFLSKGWATPAQWNRIHAPIGIEIHSETVQEIAVSISAQLIQVRQQKCKESRKPRVGIIILAAGESRRMGKSKLLLPYGESSMIETVVNHACRSSADHVLMVLGRDEKRITELIKDYDVQIIPNPDFKSGMISSVKCGLKSLPENLDAIMILLGDQPMIGPPILDELLQAYRQTRDRILVATYRGKRGHPLLFDTGFKKEILEYPTSKSLKDLLISHPVDIREIETDAPEILRDIDTEEDYKNELKIKSL